MKVARDIMTREIYAVTETTSLETLTKLLRDHSISGVPVMNRQGWPIGVVSIYDLVYQGGLESDPELPSSQYWNSGAHLPRGFHELAATGQHLTVKDIMTPAVFAVEEDTPLGVICEYFLRGQIHRVLVTRGGELTGIITSSDLIGELSQMLGSRRELSVRLLGL
ncbi:MAG: CBS domain-containing protein [Candidatus Eremiobacteraeota bacterium]|nr:CBS domain-containing protein [Candidatus Eremiobacteraeota bacterium]